MKVKIALLISAAFWTFSAKACPELDGIYVTLDQTLVRFEQVDCSLLSETTASSPASGAKPQWHKPKVFRLDRPTNCDGQEKCESATATPEAILFHNSPASALETPEHARCLQNGYSASVNEAGDLIAKFQVYDCADSFRGEITRTLRKY